MRAFISYSHVDARWVERLKTHMAQMERDGTISSFYDREIPAGGLLDKEISDNLERSELFLAVASPDFLNSKYCIEREMARALEMHAEGEIIVVPIIAEPCDWQNSPLGALKAVPQDGKPISEFQNPNTAFFDIVQELRKLIRAQPVSPSVLVTNETPDSLTEAPKKPSPVFRIKKSFDAVEKFKFREAAFREIADYFEKACSEIGSVDGVKSVFRRLGPYSFTCTVVNEAFGRGVAHLTVHAGTDSGSMGDIFWNNQENGPTNSANGWWSISHDEYQQYLTGGSMMHSNDRIQFSPKDAAEAMWNDFIEDAGISYA